MYANLQIKEQSRPCLNLLPSGPLSLHLFPLASFPSDMQDRWKPWQVGWGSCPSSCPRRVSFLLEQAMLSIEL